MNFLSHDSSAVELKVEESWDSSWIRHQTLSQWLPEILWVSIEKGKWINDENLGRKATCRNLNRNTIGMMINLVTETMQHTTCCITWWKIGEKFIFPEMKKVFFLSFFLLVVFFFFFASFPSNKFSLSKFLPPVWLPADYWKAKNGKKTFPFFR